MVTNGFYKISYAGRTGSGFGLLAFLGGVVSGLDEAGVQYEGTYDEDSDTGAVQFSVRATIPANVGLVIGVPPKAEAWSFTVDAVLPPGFDTGTPVPLRTPYGPVKVEFRLMRAL